MTTNICECHCGTRIDLDEQLLEQREMWKEKYLCLQKQFKVDIQTLKDNIYAECAGIMQQQFSSKEQEHTKIVNQKNSQVKDLISRIITLEAQVKVATKEKQILEQKVRELEAENKQKNQTLLNLKTKSANQIRQLEQRNQQELLQTKQKLGTQAKDGLGKVEAEREVLRQKLKQFQTNYQKILPEVQKLKTALQNKTSENQHLVQQIEKLRKRNEEIETHHTGRFDDIKGSIETYSQQIRNLSRENEDLQRELQKCKKISKEVRVEAVYIDRPVEVEKVVEKIVEVQRIVNKYVQNPNESKRLKNLEDNNQKLKDEINNMLRQISEMQSRFNQTVHQFEDSIKEHQKNSVLYKKQRQALAARITQQNKQLQLLQNFVQKIGTQRAQKPQNDSEKIVVHVKKDGTYQKTVQKLPNTTAVDNKRRK